MILAWGLFADRLRVIIVPGIALGDLLLVAGHSADLTFGACAEPLPDVVRQAIETINRASRPAHQIRPKGPEY